MSTTSKDARLKTGGFHRILRDTVGFSLVVALVQMQVLPAYAEVIIDGRTQTQVVTTGLVTDVTTSTIVGNNGFNSFERLSVEQMATVNLHQPEGTGALINVVRGGTTTVDGTLNAMQNGQVGGNVFIVNPNGMVVSSSGVINAGALTVSTASSSFADRLINSAGQVDALAHAKLLSGSEPLSANGAIEIYGQINARRLELRAGARMIVDGRLNVVDAQGKITGNAAVNTTGRSEAAGVSVGRNGVIRLFSKGDMRIAGQVKAQRGTQGGTIRAKTRQNMTLGGEIDTTGLAGGKAGDIMIFADGSALLEESAKITTTAFAGDGGMTGAGGGIAGGGTGAGGAASASGLQGAFTIGANSITVQSKQYSAGQNIVMSATDTITIKSGITISTRTTSNGASDNQATAPSFGKSGNLLMGARTIVLEEGSAIYAQDTRVNGTGGLVMMLATDQRSSLSAPIDNTVIQTGIAIKDATIHAGSVVIYSNALSEFVVNRDPVISQDDALTAVANEDNESFVLQLLSGALDSVETLFDEITPGAEDVLSSIPVQVQTLTARSQVRIDNSTIITDGNFDTETLELVFGVGSGFDNNGILSTTRVASALNTASLSGLIQKRWKFKDTDQSYELSLPADFDPEADSLYVHSHAGTTAYIAPLAVALGTIVTNQSATSRLTISDSALTSNAGNVVLNSTVKENSELVVKPYAGPYLVDIGASIGVIVANRNLTNQLLVDGGSITSAGDLDVRAMSGKEHVITNVANAGAEGFFAVAVTVANSFARTEAALSGDVTTGNGGNLNLDAETIYFAKTNQTNALIGVDPDENLVRLGAGIAFSNLLNSITRTKDLLGGTKNTPETSPKNGYAGGYAIDLGFDYDDTYATLGGQYHRFGSDGALIDLPTTTVNAAGTVNVNAGIRFASALQGGRGLERDVQAKANSTLPVLFQLRLFLQRKVDSTTTESDLVSGSGNALFLNASVASMSGDTIAEIGSNATVTAQAVEVNARTAYDLSYGAQSVGLGAALAQGWKDFKDIAKFSFTQFIIDDELENDPTISSSIADAVALSEFLSPLNYITTWSGTRGAFEVRPTSPGGSTPSKTDQDYAIGISANYFSTDNRTEAVVRNGATIRTNAGADGVRVNASTAGLFLHMYNLPFELGQGVLAAAPNNGLGAGVTIGRNLTDVFATIEDNVTINTNKLSVTANNDKVQLTGAFGGGGAEEIGFNFSAGINIVENQTKARISDLANVTVSDGTVIEATDAMTAWSTSGSATTSDYVGVGATGAVNFVTRDTQASLSAEDSEAALRGTVGEARFSSDGLTIATENTGLIIATTVAGARVSGKSVGTTPDADDANDAPNGSIQHFVAADKAAQLSSVDDVDGDGVISDHSQKTDTPAPTQPDTPADSTNTASSQRTGMAAAAAVSISFVDQTAWSGISSNAQIDLNSGTLDIEASNTTQAFTIAGALAGVGAGVTMNNALAGAFSVTQDDRATKAFINGATVKGAELVSLDATDTSSVFGIALGGAGAAKGSTSFAGSFTFTQMLGYTKAEVKDAELDTPEGDVTVDASDTSTNVALGGAGALNSSVDLGVGFGAGIAINAFNRDTIAEVIGSGLLTAELIDIRALSDVTIFGFGVSGGLGRTGAAGSISVNLLSGDTRGGIDYDIDTPKVTTTALTIDVDERSKIWSFSGAVAVGMGSVALGAYGGAASTNFVNTTTKAVLSDADVLGKSVMTEGGPVASAYTVAVTADSTALIMSLAAAGAAAGSGTGIGVGISVNQMDSDITTEVHRTTVSLADSILVRAKANRTIRSLAGGGAWSTTAAAGFAATVNVLTGTETRTSLNNSTLSTSGQGAIRATAQSDGRVDTIAAAVSASDDFAIGGSVTLNLSDASTLLNAINTNLNAGGSVILMTDDDMDLNSFAGGASLAAKGAYGGAIAGNVISHTSKVDTQRARLSGEGMDLLAYNNSTISSQSVGLAGAADAAWSGSFSINNVGNLTRVTSNAAALNAKTMRLRALAEKTTVINAFAGAFNASIESAVGGSFVVNNVHDTVDTNVVTLNNVAAKSIEILAINDATITGKAGSGSASQAGSFAGSFVYNQIGSAQAQDEELSATKGASPGLDPALNTQKAVVDLFDDTKDQLRDSIDAAIKKAGGNENTLRFTQGEDTTTATLYVSRNLALSPRLRADDITVLAEDRSDINSFSGAFAFGASSYGVGAAVSVNRLYGQALADVSTNVPRFFIHGSLNARAVQLGTVTNQTLGISASAEFGGSASVTVNLLNRKAITRGAGRINSLQSRMVAEPGNSVAFSSSQTGTVNGIADTVSISGANSGGGAVAINVIADDALTEILNLNIEVSDADVRISSDVSEDIVGKALAVAAGGAGTFGGALVVNTNAADVGSRLNDTYISARDIFVTSDAISTIEAKATSIAASGSTGIALGIAVNGSRMTVRTDVDRAILDAGRDVYLTALADQTLDANAVSVAVAGSVAASGSSVANKTNNLVETLVRNTSDTLETSAGGSSVVAQGSVILAARADTVIGLLGGADNDEPAENDGSVLSGQFAVGGTSGYGASVAVNDTTNRVNAKVLDGSRVVGLGKADLVRALGGTVLADGVTITADAQSIIDMVSVNASAGLSQGVTGLFTVNLIGDESTVQIGDGSTPNRATVNGLIEADRGTDTNLVTATDPVDGATVDYASQDQKTRIASSADSFIKTYAGGGGVGGNVGAGLSSQSTIVKSKATTNIESADIGGLQFIAIASDTQTDLTAWVLGLGGGMTGAAGSIGVNILSSEAGVNLTGAQLRAGGVLPGGGDAAPLDVAGSVHVSAASDNKITSTTGAFAGGVAALAGAIQYNDFTGSAIVTVKSDADGAASALIGRNGVDVSTDVANTVTVEAAGGSVGGGAFALTVNVNKIGTTSRIDIGQSQLLTADAGALNLNANDTNTISSKSGVLAAGALGVGGSIDYVDFSGETKVIIGRNARLIGGESVNIAAASIRNVSSTVVVGAFATGFQAAAVAVSLVEIGAPVDRPTQALANLQTAEDQLQAEQGASTEAEQKDSAEGMTELSGGDATRDEVIATRSAISVLESGTDDVGVVIDTNVSVQSGYSSDTGELKGGDVFITATTTTGVKQLGGTVSAGVSAGIASGVTLATVGTDTFVNIGPRLNISADKSVVIEAKTLNGQGGKVIDQTAATVSASTGLAVGVGVARARSSSIAEVSILGALTLRGRNLENVGTLRIAANRSDVIDNRTVNLGVGTAAIGTVITRAETTGRTTVNIGRSVTGRANVDTATILATDTTKATTLGISGAGGVVAGNGVDAKAINTGKVEVALTNLNVTASEAVTVSASSAAKTKAKAQGWTFALGSIGVSLADARTDAEVDVSVTGASTITAKQVTIEASMVRPNNGANAQTDANSATGGLLGGNGAESEAYVDYSVQTRINANITGTETVRIAANTQDLEARANGNGRVGGAVAIGAVVVRAGGARTGSMDQAATTQSDATVVLEAGSLIGSDVVVEAMGGATYAVDVYSGSGGVVAGSSSVGRTYAKGLADIRVGEGGAMSIISPTVAFRSANDAQMLSTINNLSAAVVGGSGARGLALYDSEVRTNFGAGTGIQAQTIDILAANSAARGIGDGNWNIVSGSGGALDVAAMEGSVVTTGLTQINIADGASIQQTQDAITGGFGTYRIGIENNFALTDKLSLDSGGAIAIPRGVSLVSVGQTSAPFDSTLNIGNATLSSLGNMKLFNGTSTDFQSEVAATSYGLAGAATGRSEATLIGNNTININAGATLESLGDIIVGAGSGADGLQTVAVNADTRLFNKTAIPIPSDPAADATARTASVITIAQGANLKAVRDIYLSAEQGDRDVVGYGSGKDLYREAAAEVANFFGDLVNAADISLELTGGSSTNSSADGVVVNGTVRAGARNKQYLLIDENNQQLFQGEATPEAAQDITFTVTNGVSVAYTINDRIAVLDGFINNPIFAQDDAAVAAWTDERNRLNAQRAAAGNRTVTLIEVDDITAREGKIEILGDYLKGTGRIEAPGDSSIDIEIRSAAFLNLNNLSIPNDGNGQSGTVTFNRTVVRTNAQALTLSQGGEALPTNLTFVDGQTGNDPSVSVRTLGFAGSSGSDGNPLGGNIRLLGDIENFRGSVTLFAGAGDLEINGDVSAKTINFDTPFGDFTQGFTYGITNLGGDASSQYESTFNSYQSQAVGIVTEDDDYFRSTVINMKAQTSSIRAGKNVFISAEILNINGLVQAGRGEYDVNIGLGLGADIRALPAGQTGRTLLHNPSALSDVKNAHISSDVAVYYNHDLRRIEVDPMIVQGGRVELTGQIISTGGGRIEALDGLGRINLVSADPNYPIAVGRIDTGSGVINADGTTSGVEGVVRITDTSRPLGNDPWGWRPLVFEYTRIGNKMYEADNFFQTVDANGRIIPTNKREITTGDGRTASYMPGEGLTGGLENLELVTLRAVEVSTIYKVKEKETVVIGIGGINRSTVTTKERVSTTSIDLGIAPYLATGSSLTDNGLQNAIGYSVNATQQGAAVTVDNDDRTETRNTVEWYKFGSGEIEHESTETETRTILYTHRLEADKPIQIFMSGADSSSLSISTNSSLVLTDAVKNLNGRTTIQASGGTSNIVASTASAILYTGETVLNAGNNAGTASQPILIDQVDKQPLQVSAGIAIGVTEINGDMYITKANSSKARFANNSGASVYLTAHGSIIGTNDMDTSKGNAVRGYNVSLTAQGRKPDEDGKEGRIDNVVMQVSGAEFGAKGRFNASARGDILVQQVHATNDLNDLYLGKVESQTGSVFINVTGGSILDGNAVQTVDTRTEAELLSLWIEELALSDGDGGDVTNAGGSAARIVAQTEALKNRRVAEYNRYWNQRDADGGAAQTFTLDAATEASLRAGGWTDDDVAAYRQDMSSLYSTWNARPETTRDTSFQYVVQGDELNELLDGVTWTTDELTSSIKSTLVRPVGDTVAVIEDPNVSAFRNIGLFVNNVGEDIGSLAAPLVVRAGENLSANPRRRNSVLGALAAAERSDVLFFLPNGSTLTGPEFEAYRDAGGSTDRVEMRIQRVNDVDVAFTGFGTSGVPLGSLQALSKGVVYLGGETAVDVARISGNKDIQIKISGNLTDTAKLNSFAVSGKRIVLEAGNDGNIGTSAANPFDVELLSGKLEARAGGDVYLNSVSEDDLQVSGIFAGGALNLTAAGAIVDGFNAKIARILASDISINAPSIGTEDQAFGVSLISGSTGSVQAQSTSGALHLATFGETRLTQFKSANIGRLLADDALILDGTEVIDVNTMYLVANGGMTITGTSGDSIRAPHLTMLVNGTVGSEENRVGLYSPNLTVFNDNALATTLPTKVYLRNSQPFSEVSLVVNIDETIPGGVFDYLAGIIDTRGYISVNSGLVKLTTTSNVIHVHSPDDTINAISAKEVVLNSFTTIGRGSERNSPSQVLSADSVTATAASGVELWVKGRSETDIKFLKTTAADAPILLKADSGNALELLDGFGGITTQGGDITLDVANFSTRGGIVSKSADGSSSGNIEILAARFDQTAGVVRSGTGSINLETTGDATIYSLESEASFGFSRTAVRLVINGDLVARPNAQRHILANATNGLSNIFVNGRIIGTLRTKVNYFRNLGANFGNIKLQEEDSLTLGNISASGGSITAYALGSLNLNGSIQVSDTATFAADGNIKGSMNFGGGQRFSLISYTGSIYGSSPSQNFLGRMARGGVLNLFAKYDVNYTERSERLNANLVLSDLGNINLLTDGSLFGSVTETMTISKIGAADTVNIVTKDAVNIGRMGLDGAIKLSAEARFDPNDTAPNVRFAAFKDSRVLHTPRVVDITTINTGGSISIGTGAVKEALGLRADSISPGATFVGGAGMRQLVPTIANSGTYIIGTKPSGELADFFIPVETQQWDGLNPQFNQRIFVEDTFAEWLAAN